MVIWQLGQSSCSSPSTKELHGQTRCTNFARKTHVKTSHQIYHNQIEARKKEICGHLTLQKSTSNYAASQWICLRLLSCCSGSYSVHTIFYAIINLNWYFNLWRVEKTKLTEKEAGIGQFFFKKNLCSQNCFIAWTTLFCLSRDTQLRWSKFWGFWVEACPSSDSRNSDGNYFTEKPS